MPHFLYFSGVLRKTDQNWTFLRDTALILPIPILKYYRHESWITFRVAFVYAPTISLDKRPYSFPIDKTLQKRQKTGYNGPNPLFPLIKKRKNSWINGFP